MPESLRRVAKGEYEVHGTQLRIVQGDEGKWTVQGHSDDLGAFGSGGAALGKLQELGLVPDVPAEQPQAEKPAEEPKTEAKAEERKEQPKGRPRGPEAAGSERSAPP